MTSLHIVWLIKIFKINAYKLCDLIFSLAKIPNHFEGWVFNSHLISIWILYLSGCNRHEIQYGEDFTENVCRCFQFKVDINDCNKQRILIYYTQNVTRKLIAKNIILLNNEMLFMFKIKRIQIAMPIWNHFDWFLINSSLKSNIFSVLKIKFWK